MRVTLLLAATLAVGGCRAESAPEVPTHVVKREKLERLVTAEGNLRAVNSTPIVPPRVPGRFGPMKLAWIAEDGSRVKKDDVLVRFDRTELERQLRDGESDHAKASAMLAKEHIAGRSAAAKREASARLADRALEKTRRFREKDPEIYSRDQIIESEIDEKLSKARRQHAEDAKKIERGLSRSKAALVAVEQRKAQMAISQARAGLDSLEVRAPHDGLLVLRRDHRGNVPRVGEQVWAGRKLAEIPLLEEMEAEVFVLEVDGAGLVKDTPARVVVEARPDLEFSGVVLRVDDLAKERVRGVPVQYFAAVIKLEATDTDVMKPGQRVRATLTLGGSEALVVPRQAVFSKGNEHIVYRKSATGFEPVVVELGTATSGRVAITSGIDADDVIALRDPELGPTSGTSGSSNAEGSGR